MNTLLFFLFTLISGSHCVAWLPDNGDYSETFESYSDIQSIDVYPSSEISDRIVDRLFPIVYTIQVNGKDSIIQCQKD